MDGAVYAYVKNGYWYFYKDNSWFGWQKTIGFMIPTEIHYTLQKRGETQWQQIPQVATVTEMAR